MRKLRPREVKRLGKDTQQVLPTSPPCLPQSHLHFTASGRDAKNRHILFGKQKGEVAHSGFTCFATVQTSQIKKNFSSQFSQKLSKYLFFYSFIQKAEWQRDGETEMLQLLVHSGLKARSQWVTSSLPGRWQWPKYLGPRLLISQEQYQEGG